MSIDNLLSAEIVTADGQVRTASATENADLFWALRGAGSNFGVVTSFEFRAHPVGPVVQLCAPFYALDDGRTVLRAWREFTATAADSISSLAIVWSVPDVDAFPAELRRRPVVILATVYAGPPEEGARIMQPLRELAAPLLDLSGPMPYAVLQAAFDPFFPKGRLLLLEVHERPRSERCLHRRDSRCRALETLAHVRHSDLAPWRSHGTCRA